MAKTIKIGINGFGRIGRFVFRAAMSRPDITVVGINDLCPVDYLAYMLKYDTMHGAFEGTIKADVEKSLLIVNGKKIRVTACKDAAELAWDKVGAEYIVEATGLNLTKEIGDAMTASFYVNNIFNFRPSDRYETSGAFRELGIPMFFGFELKVNIK